VNADSIVDAFGNVPSMIVNAAFPLRSPIDYIHALRFQYLDAKDIPNNTVMLRNQALRHVKK
jgi:hypothetical protein